MKNIKMLAAGFAAGAVCMVATSAIAANFNVTAELKNDIIFKINDTDVASPSDQPVLNYNNRIYVPIRFVAEQLDCEVNWDVANRRVTVVSPEPEVQIKEVIKEVEKIVYVDSEESGNEDKVVYSSLPIKKSTSEYTLNVTGMTREPLGGGTKVLIEFENKSESALQINQVDAKLTVDGKEYQVYPGASFWDQTWFGYIARDKEEDGYLLFDEIPEDYEKCTLEFSIRDENGGTKDSYDVKLNFKRK